MTAHYIRGYLLGPYINIRGYLKGQQVRVGVGVQERFRVADKGSEYGGG